MKKQYISILASLLLLLGYGPKAMAQVPSEGGVMGYFQIGNSGLDMSKLNTSLTAAGYGSMPQNFVTLGGGGHLFYKHIVLGGEGTSYVVNIASTQNNFMSARLNGGAGFFNIGYLVCSGVRWKIYPMLGIGGGRYKLEIVQNQNQNLNGLLTSPQSLADEKMESSGFLLNLSLNISTAIPASKSKGNAGPIILGIRGGYMYQPSANPWEFDFNDVNSSSMRMQGWYAMFQVGFGGWTKKAKETDNTLPAMPLPED